MKSPRSGRLWKIIGGVAAVALLLLFFTWEDGDQTTPSAEDRFETKVATVETVEEIVTGSFTIEDRSAEDATPVIHTSGVVTELMVEKDEAPEALEHLMDIDGRPVFAIVGGTPFYREITSRTSDGDDIRTLEDNLVAAGYEVGEVDGKADSDLRDAIKKWQKDEDRKQTGVFDPTSFIWLPSDFIVDEVLVDVGGVVSFETPVVHMRKKGDLVAVARIEQGAITDVRNGLDVSLRLDGLPDSDLSGTVTQIEDQPIDGTSNFLVEIRIGDLGEGVREGMRGDAEILVTRHRDVVVVPTGAVGGPVNAPSVRVLANGNVEIRTIKVGVVTPAETVIISGVAAGELVVVAEKEA